MGLPKSSLIIIISRKGKEADEKLNSRDNRDVMQEISRDPCTLHSFVVDDIYQGNTM